MQVNCYTWSSISDHKDCSKSPEFLHHFHVLITYNLLVNSKENP